MTPKILYRDLKSGNKFSLSGISCISKPDSISPSASRGQVRQAKI
jgi:hypothetical protein